MNTPNPRSLGDFPDDPRFLKDEAGDESREDPQSHSRILPDDDPDQGFQDPMSEEDTASGGPADPPRN